MKNNYIPASYFVMMMFTFLGCNLDVNTSDPQFSRDIQTSKKDRFYLCAYEGVNQSPILFKIKEAWLEYSWKNQVNLWRKIKVKTGWYQLNFKLDSLINSDFKNDEYLINWRMEAKSYGYISSSDVYSLALKKEHLSDTFIIVVSKLGKERRPIPFSKFYLTKSAK